MDFSSQYHQYGTGHQAYTFLPVQPLTPSSHSASGAASDDFGHTSPPDGFDTLGGDQFTGYDYNNQGGLPQGSTLNAAFPGPPTPPNQAFGQQRHHLHHQEQPGSLAGQVDGLQQHQQGSSPEDGQGIKGGSEDDDMTPAQSRRKAQNRAAQRAFRERKEKHVKDLEIKLASLEAAQQQSSVENERLKRDLQKMSTENEILRATSGVHGGDPHNRTLHRSASSASQPDHHTMTTGPSEYNPTDFYSDILKEHANKVPSHRIVLGDDGERLLAAGATWDYIVSHELYKRGLVDVGSVSERLKGTARCDGQGPVFPEGAILSAIEQSVASGSDDLL